MIRHDKTLFLSCSIVVRMFVVICSCLLLVVFVLFFHLLMVSELWSGVRLLLWLWQWFLGCLRIVTAAAVVVVAVVRLFCCGCSFVSVYSLLKIHDVINSNHAIMVDK